MDAETPTTEARPPIYAEVTMSSPHETMYAVYVFDKKINQTVQGDGHKDIAARSVDQLNEYFGREWDGVRQTHATIMHEFTEALGRVGVDSATIQAAVDELVAHVG